jgi:hypothetical protein
MSSVPASIAPRVGQLIRLLASDRDGEVVAAARALKRTLTSAGQDFHSLADSLERSSAPAVSVHYEYTAPRADAAARWLSTHHMARLTPKEQAFVRDMVTWGRPATERQAAWLRSIVERVSGRRRAS